MHIKEQDKDKTIFIKYNSWQSEEIICRTPTKPQFIFAWINFTNSIAFEIMKIIFILIKKKNKGKQEIIWKSKKTCEFKY